MGISKTVRELLADNERRVLASELSACIRALDHADRREAADKDTTPYLATAILQLDAAAKGIAAYRPKHSEPVDQFIIDEHATLKAQVDDLVRKYLTRIGDPDYVRLGAVAWAKQVVRRIAAEKAAAEARRAAKPVAGKTAVLKASGKCRRCGKQSSTLNTADGICHSCFLRSQEVRGKRLPVKSKGLNQAHFDELFGQLDRIAARRR